MHTERMGEAARRVATYADLQAVPAHLVAEIVEGELYTQSRPAMPHAYTCIELAGWARGHFKHGAPGSGWWIVCEPEIHFGKNVCVPDIAGWRKERMPRFPKSAYVTLAPDWICEIISPSTQGFDRIKKMSVYAQAGVKYVWLVDPLEHILEAYALNDGIWSRFAGHADNECVRVAPFEREELDMSELWAELEEEQN